MRIWIPLIVLVIVLMMFAGLLPMPGQKDKATPNTQPSPAGTSPQAELPKGPPPSPPADNAADARQPPPGGTPAASPGGAATGSTGSSR